jgi:hypothetical protein
MLLVAQSNVDSLDPERHAMKQSTDDFVEIPRWVRLFKSASSGGWMGAKPLGRREAHVQEAFCVGGGVAFLIASFVFSSASVATALRVSAAFMFGCGYLLSVSIRIFDTYKMWPAAEIAWTDWRPVRTLRTTVGFYAFVVLVLASFFTVLFWVGGA